MTSRLSSALVLLVLLCTAAPLGSSSGPAAPAAPAAPVAPSAPLAPVAPAGPQGLAFSHVYKIDIPGSSGCKLELLPTQDETGLQTDGSSSKESDVIFRHSIRLQAPACDCEASEGFKALMYRVNGLEEEVTYLKTQCTPGCCGGGGAAAVDPTCSGHGSFQPDSCSCVCSAGWDGPACSASSCPGGCSGGGRCEGGRCVCRPGFRGDDCSRRACPNDCSDKGRCEDGTCVCFPHFTGDDCRVQKCPGGCGRGRCESGRCACEDGFYGDDCSSVSGPQGLRLLQATGGSLLVQWESVVGAEFYILTHQPKNQPSAQQQVRVPNTDHSFLITGLSPGVTHLVQVYAVVKGTQSEADKMEATTDVSAVGGIKVLGQTEVSIQVDWENPSAEVDLFRLTHTDPSGQQEQQEVQRNQEARTTHTIVGLHPGTEYQISVQAVRGLAEGRASSVTAATDIDAPSHLVTVAVTEDTATVSWDLVQAEIDGYMLSYSSAEGSSPDIPVGRDQTSYRLLGLKPGTVHTVDIWTFEGSRVSRKSSTTAETELDAPTNLLAGDETESSFSVSWDHSRAEVDGYVLTFSSSEGDSEEVRLGSDITSHELAGLRPGVLYSVYIWAFRGSRASSRSSTQADTELDAPANLSARDETQSSFSVSWDPARAEIDGYVLSYSSSEGDSGEIPVGPDSSSYELTGLRPGVLHSVYIWTFRGSRASSRSSTQAETDIDAPTQLKASGVTLDSASFSWVPPLADIEGYSLTYREEQGNKETVEEQLDGLQSSFSVSGLETGRSYLVSIAAFRGDKRSSVVETVFRTVGLLYPFPMDCIHVMKNGNKKSGVYTVYVNSNASRPLQAFCDMQTDGGGWLVLQRRTSGQLDFMKRWRQYIAGFGNMTDEFWIGMEKIYELTNTPTAYELRFDLGLGAERAHAVYDGFKIAPLKQKYKISIGKYRGTAGDAMTYHQGRPWTTIDNDNDIALGNCALVHRGAWWYKNCHLANINGKWADNRHSLGVNWEPWKGHLVSLDFTEMKIRPVGSSSSRKRRALKTREKISTSDLQMNPLSSSQ